MKFKKGKKLLLIVILGLAAVIGYELLLSGNKDSNSTPIPPATQDFDVAALNNQIVLIKHTTTEYTNYGSGVVVGFDDAKTYVLTNAHVLENLGTVEIINGSIQLNAQVVPDSFNHELDMVLLSIPKNDQLVPVKFATSYNVGSLVFAAGYHNQSYDISAGLITSINSDRINSNARINPGQSGSGLFNSELELVGLNKQYVVDSNDAWLSTISIKVEAIITYLDTYL